MSNNNSKNKIQIKVDYNSIGQYKLELDSDSNPTLETVLRILNIPPDSVITLINNRPVPLNTQLTGGEYIKLLRIASGG